MGSVVGHVEFCGVRCEVTEGDTGYLSVRAFGTTVSSRAKSFQAGLRAQIGAEPAKTREPAEIDRTESPVSDERGPGQPVVPPEPTDTDADDLGPDPTLFDGDLDDVDDLDGGQDSDGFTLL